MNGFLCSSLTLVWGLIILIWIVGNYFPHVKSVLQNGAPCLGPHSEITVSTWEIVPLPYDDGPHFIATNRRLKKPGAACGAYGTMFSTY